MTDRLVFSPGPKLIWHFRDEEPVDVKQDADAYLFENVDLSESPTVRDVYLLMRDHCPNLIATYRRLFAVEVLREFTNGSSLPATDTDVHKTTHVEFQRYEEENTAEGMSDGFNYSVCAMSEPLKEDDDSGVWRVGEVIPYAISFCTPQSIAHLPLRLADETIVTESDPFSTKFAQSIRRYRNTKIKLGDLIYALLWELTWHGVSTERDDAKAEILEKRNAVDVEEVKTYPIESLFEPERQRAYAALMNSIVGIDAPNADEVYETAQSIPDADNAAEFLERSFPGVRVMDAYRSLNGRDFRKAWSDVTYATNANVNGAQE